LKSLCYDARSEKHQITGGIYSNHWALSKQFRTTAVPYASWRDTTTVL